MLRKKVKIALVIFAALVLATVGGAIHLATGLQSEGRSPKLTVIEGEPSVLKDIRIEGGYIATTPDYEGWNAYEPKRVGYRVDYELDYEDAFSSQVSYGHYDGGTYVDDVIVMGDMQFAYPSTELEHYLLPGDAVVGHYHEEIFSNEKDFGEGYIEDYMTFAPEDRFLGQKVTDEDGKYDVIYGLPEYSNVFAKVSVLDEAVYFVMDMGYGRGTYDPWTGQPGCSCKGFGAPSGEAEPYNGELEPFWNPEVHPTVKGGLYVYSESSMRCVVPLDNVDNYDCIELYACQEANKIFILGAQGDTLVAHIYDAGTEEMTEIILWEECEKPMNVVYRFCVNGELGSLYVADVKGEERIFVFSLGEEPEVLWTRTLDASDQMHGNRGDIFDCNGLSACIVDDRLYVGCGEEVNGGQLLHLWVVEDEETIFRGVVSMENEYAYATHDLPELRFEVVGSDVEYPIPTATGLFLVPKQE